MNSMGSMKFKSFNLLIRFLTQPDLPSDGARIRTELLLAYGFHYGPVHAMEPERDHHTDARVHDADDRGFQSSN